MEFNFKPWRINVDVEKTKKYYSDNDDSITKEVNKKFVKILSEQQKAFFEQLGVDIEKIKIDYHNLQNDGALDVGIKESYEASFLVCGKLLSITPFQAAVYGDEETFGKVILDEVEVVDMSDCVNSIGDMQYSFRHPAVAFPEKRLEEWDCGFVCGKVMLKV